MSEAMQKVVEAANSLSNEQHKLEYQTTMREQLEARTEAAQTEEARLQVAVKDAEKQLKSASAALAAEPAAAAEPRFRCGGCRAPVGDREAGVSSCASCKPLEPAIAP